MKVLLIQLEFLKTALNLLSKYSGFSTLHVSGYLGNVTTIPSSFALRYDNICDKSRRVIITASNSLTGGSLKTLVLHYSHQLIHL